MRRILAVVGAAVVVAGGVAWSASAAGTSQNVTCTSDGTTLSCPLPAPVTVTETATETAPGSTVTEQGPTTTVTILSTVTQSPDPTTSTVSTATTEPPTTSVAPTTITPPTTTAAPANWPGPTNTGVPAGTTLTTYTGSCNLSTAGQTIDAKTINCDVIVNATGVKITRSHINGRIGSTGSGTISITDSYINGGNQENFPAVGQEGVTLLRDEVTGGQHSVQCWESCTVTDSWLHGQYLPSTSAGHVNAFITNGGNGFTLTHNTLDCSVTATSHGGGCTADASLFGDFSQVDDVTLQGNLFVSHSTQAGYCLQAGYNPGKKYPNATNVRVLNNVWQHGTNGKCGQWGPVTAYNDAATGNQWSGNTWDDGTPLNP